MDRLETKIEPEKKAEKDKKKKRTRPNRPRVSAREYFRGIKTEMKKVVWPTKKELVSFTTVVIIACTFFALLFAAVDSSFLAALRVVLGISMGG